MNSYGECEPCESSCLHCADNECLECMDQMFYNEIKQCIPDCGSGNYGDADTRVCMACNSQAGCAKCDAWDLCTDCSNGYYLNYLSECVGCTSHCDECDANTCTKCAASYYITADGVCT